MTLYVYNLDTRVVAEEIQADTNMACEELARDRYDPDIYGWTYTPAFGSIDGLKHPAPLLSKLGD
ncbi:MAG TPA: hypothetical protein VJ323_22900 [Bryobacteraceae bacterium]|jgi:hypothetical protein|nr:hypothetical protein [Bryobacteraceae bacterium]